MIVLEPYTLVSAGKTGGGRSQLRAVLLNAVGCLSKVGNPRGVANSHAILGKGADTSYLIHKFEINTQIIIGMIEI